MVLSAKPIPLSQKKPRFLKLRKRYKIQQLAQEIPIPRDPVIQRPSFPEPQESFSGFEIGGKISWFLFSFLGLSLSFISGIECVECLEFEDIVEFLCFDLGFVFLGHIFADLGLLVFVGSLLFLPKYRCIRERKCRFCRKAIRFTSGKFGTITSMTNLLWFGEL